MQYCNIYGIIQFIIVDWYALKITKNCILYRLQGMSFAFLFQLKCKNPSCIKFINAHPLKILN